MKPDSYKVHKQHTFDCFCKKVLKNEVRNFYAELQRRRNREVSLSELSEQVMEQMRISDEYPSDFSFFRVLGIDVAIENESIATAIASLTDEKRDIILLSYFLGMSDAEIGSKLNMVRRTVQYKRANSLQELKKMMEEKAND